MSIKEHTSELQKTIIKLEKEVKQGQSQAEHSAKQVGPLLMASIILYANTCI